MAHDIYGYFSESGDEYVVTRFDTPMPWVNYLSNGDYCAIVSSTGGGFSFFKSHHANMVLRREQRSLLTDRPGRYVYVRDRDSGEWWTVNVMPVKRQHRNFRAVHGMGYTSVESETEGVAGRLLYFVPRGHDGEIVRVSLANLTDRPRRLSVFFYEELQLGNYYFNEHERTITAMFQETRGGPDGIRANYKLFSTSRDHGDSFSSTEVWPYTVAVTSTTHFSAWETSQERFMGSHRELNDPLAVERGSLSSRDNLGRSGAAAFQWEVELAPGEEFRTDVATTIAPSASIEEAAARVRASADVDRLEEATRRFWRDYIGKLRVETPDPELDRTFNVWNKYQLYINFSFGRAPSAYHNEQGMGMRDSFQDAFGMIPLEPALARAQILRVASFIFADGSPCDVTSRVEYRARKGSKVDVPLWMALATCNYLRETGDWAVLEERVPYLDGGEGSLYEHILKGIQRVAREPGIHGLPLFGGGDWNDALNRVGEKGRGESVWLAQFIYFCIREIRPLLLRRGDSATLAWAEEIAERLRQSHEAHCWDGEWYRIGFNDEHAPVGTKGDRVGRVYLNTQTWAIISGIASPERQEAAMDAVDRHLETDYGLSLLRPAYDRLDGDIGVASAFAPGMKENGGVFSHASAFNLVAKALLGRGEDLHRVYRKVLPFAKYPDTYKVEPYVYSQFAAGPDSPDHGRGAYHWMTGTAAWMFRVVLDYMLGVKADYEGLRITPCIPPAWSGYRVVRPFRGDVYEICVRNPKGVGGGIAGLSLDGRKLAGDLVPVVGDGGRHLVDAVLG